MIYWVFVRFYWIEIVGILVMFSQLRVVACAALVWMAWSGTATAQSWYYGGQVGLAIADELSIDFTGAQVLDGELDSGLVVGGVIGVSSGVNPGALTGWRLEGEITYRQGDLIELGGLGASNLDGDASSLVFTANVYTDFYVGNGFTPYLGAGLGVARVSANDIVVAGIEALDDSAVGFAIQLGAGVAYELSPDLTLTADARYFSAPLLEMSDVDGADVEITSYGDTTFLVGVRLPF